ncbi:MAG: iron uptake porin [Xenococcaceae cyanobacterium MO_188.B32]|nr:iron uptake porin [Xenococcaceae cyanobacterium MO_188.B32]
MFDNVWKYKLLRSTVLGMSLIVFSPLTVKAQVAADNDNRLLEKLEQYSQEELNSVNQVTNVNQLRDVSPTDWAYEALRSLVDRYGCIVGYPNQTYRGNRALSRYEFAAGLNACLNQIERLIASSEAILREDLDTLNRLVQEFEAELATLTGRVDNLENRIAFLEDHQFSTTTKLSGEVIFASASSWGDDNDNQTIYGDRVRLEFNSSFDGRDRLVTRLAAGNFGSFRNDYEVDATINGVATTTELTDLESATTTRTYEIFPGEDNDVSIDWLAYYRPVELGKFLQFDGYLAAFGGIHSHYVPTLNPYFEDFDGGNGAMSTFATENPIYRIGGGAGGAANFNYDLDNSIFKSIGFSVGYLAGSAGDPSEGAGLFNGDYGLLGQVHVNIVERVDLGFTYVRGFHKADSPIFGSGAADGLGIVGTAFANLSESELVDAFGPQGGFFEIGDKKTNNFGTQLAWRINDRINFSAFFTYTDVELAESNQDGEIWTYGAGLAFPDLLKQGAVLGIFAGVQPYLGIESVSGVNISTKNPLHLEAFFKYPLRDNVSVTPGIIYLGNPEQTDDSEDQFITTIRTTFTF